ncbi:hypothetical protein G9A89_012684 [Geosiphon pyriformis]|nr:hypothetical protein G9A89_012684 [Geosiphon pyriformis]
MTTTRAKSKKAAPDICPKTSNKISTREALSVVKTIRQNILKAFLLPSNRDKLLLVVTKATFLSLASFLPISSSVAFTLIKSLKVFNNRPINKLVFPSIDSTLGATSTTPSKKIVKKTKSSEKWRQSLVSAIVISNFFVVPNEILDKISIASSSTSFKMDQDHLLAVLSNIMSFGRSLPVLEAKQFFSVGSSIETKSSFPSVFGATSGGAWETIFMASILVSGTTFKIKLVHIKTVFQSVHGFLDAKSVSKNNVKLFCVEFASQVSLKAAFLVELTSSVHLATLKIAKFLVISESGSPFAAVVLHDMLLGVSTANIKMALSVFGSVTYVVLKSAGIWQYMVVYFEKLNSAMSALNHWSVLVDKDSVRILSLINQNETILSHNKFKAKLVNLFSGCTAFEISDMISQVSSQTCFISRSPESGCHFWFALVTFGSQANLDSAIVKTDCKIFSPSPSKLPKMFTPHFVGSKSYAKASAPVNSSGFSPLLPLVFSPVAVDDPLVLSQLSSLKSDLTKLSVLVEFIVKSIGSLVVTFEQFINSDLVSSSALSLKINKVLVHMGFFSKTVGKLRREVVSLKKECCMEDIDMSGDSELSPVVSDKMFFNLMSLWEHESVVVKTDLFKTAKWLVGLVSCSATLFSVIQKMSSLGKFFSVASA